MALPVVNVYQRTNYPLRIDEAPRHQKRCLLISRLDRIRELYPEQGMRTAVEGVLLMWADNSLLLVLLNHVDGRYELPGGRIKGQETDIEGLKRKLNKRFAFSGLEAITPIQWEIGECVGVWWRRNYEGQMSPVRPTDVQPTECRKIFLVHLPERLHFSIPNNINVVGVKLCDLYSNSEKYGERISSLALQLSRFEFRMIQSID